LSRCDFKRLQKTRAGQ